MRVNKYWYYNYNITHTNYWENLSTINLFINYSKLLKKITSLNVKMWKNNLTSIILQTWDSHHNLLEANFPYSIPNNNKKRQNSKGNLLRN